MTTAQTPLDPCALERAGVVAADEVPALLVAARTSDGAARADAIRAAGILLRELAEVARRDAASYRRFVRLGRRSAPHLTELLTVANRGDRFHLYAAIGSLGSRGSGAVPGMVAHAIGADAAELAAISRALGQVGPRGPVAVPLLEHLLDHGDPAVRMDASFACRRLGPLARPLGDRLAALAADERSRTRANALVALAGFDRYVAPHLRAIVGALDDLEPEVRFAAVWSLDHGLAALGPDHPAVDAAHVVLRVAPLLRDDLEDVRWWAASTLGRLGPAAGDAVAPLVERLAVERDSVQESIVWALNCIGPHPESLSSLCEALEHGSTYTREVVARILERYGPAAAVALPTLEAMLGEDSDAGGTVRRLIRTIRRQLDRSE